MFRRLIFCMGFPLLLGANASAGPVQTWDFRTPDAAVRTTGKLRGTTKFTPEGLCITDQSRKKPQGFALPYSPDQTPPGGFRFEVDFTMGAPTLIEDFFFIWDNKGCPYEKSPEEVRKKKVHHGFMIGFRRLPQNEYLPVASLGYAAQMAMLYGPPVTLVPGQRASLSFTFDGANQAEFRINGKRNSLQPVYPGGPVAKAVLPAVIGDRFQSSYLPFNGTIHSVTLTHLPAEKLGVTLVGRRAFQRGEETPELTLQLGNYDEMPLHNLRVTGSIEGVRHNTELLPELKQGETAYLKLPVETRFKNGTYRVELQLTGLRNGRNFTVKREQDILIGPEAPPDNFPIVIWGYSGPHSRLQEIGFTHATTQGFRNPTQHRDESGKPPAHYQMRMDYLDAMLRDGFQGFDSIEMRYLEKRFPRYDRAGKPRRLRNVEASNPEVRAIAAKLASNIGGVFGGHPALAGVLINSEHRDRTAPSFGKYEPASFRKFAGFDIPPDIDAKTAPDYRTLPDFPLNRIVPDSDPRLIFFRWFWKSGDGWNPLQTLLAENYKQTIRRPFLSFHDPAVRVPPLWGSGGKVDALSHWTYAYPDPFRVVTVTDETSAMAEGRPGQKIMTMTQLFAKCPEVCPDGTRPPELPEWRKRNLKAQYATLPPDALREAIWGMLARPVSGIMFHGLNAVIFIPRRNSGYVMTNPDTVGTLRDMLHNVITPLGPLVSRLRKRASGVGILQSFTSAMYAGRGTWGWRTWAFDANVMMHWAKLNPEILYEEKILRGGLDGIRILFLPHCDVLNESTFQAIRKFQENGGILISDECLTPALTPNIRIRSMERSLKSGGAEDKRKMQETARGIRKSLAEYFLPYADSDNSDFLIYPSCYGTADYLCVINDKRSFGDYFGPWRQMQEKGEPNSGTLTVRRSAGAVYELSRGGKVPFTGKNGITEIRLDFSTCDGRMLMLLDSPLAALKLQVPQKVKAGTKLNFSVSVLDGAGTPVNALLPLEIQITPPEGDRIIFHTAIPGTWHGSRQTALNDPAGVWTLKVRERASGLAETCQFELYR